MRRQFLMLTIFLMLAAAAAFPVEAQRQKATPESGAEPKVSVKSFGPQNVIGLLGHPLGTVVRVTGVAFDGSATRMKALDGKTMLRIEAVNGVLLSEEVTFEFGRTAHEIRKPSFGEQFDYYVHEYGAFDGVVDIPRELNIQKDIIANDGFHYRRSITVHKSNQEKSSKK